MSRKIAVIGIVTGGTSYASTAITEINLTGNTNNLVIPGLDSFSLVEMTSDGNFNLTGIAVPDPEIAYELKVFNNGVNNIIIKNQSASSTAQNRFSNGGDITMQPEEGFVIIYRPTVQRWSCAGKNI